MCLRVQFCRKKEEEHSRRMEVQRKRRKELMEANKAESDARSLEWEKRRELEKQGDFGIAELTIQ